MAKLIGKKALNHAVSHLGQVRSEIQQEANERGGRARAKLSGHRRTGNASVEVEHGAVDSFIILQDESTQAAMSIEYGHSWRGKHVSGLYIISGAAGLV